MAALIGVGGILAVLVIRRVAEVPAVTVPATAAAVRPKKARRPRNQLAA